MKAQAYVLPSSVAPHALICFAVICDLSGLPLSRLSPTISPGRHAGALPCSPPRSWRHGSAAARTPARPRAPSPSRPPHCPGAGARSHYSPPDPHPRRFRRTDRPTARPSQIRQPPRPGPRLERRVPLAERIERRHHAEPHQVDHGQPEAVALREKEKDVAQLRSREALGDPGGDRERVHHIEVGHIEKERHPPERDE